MSQVSINRTQSPSEAKLAITKCFEANTPVFLWGAPGIGKSDIVHQIAEEQGRDVVDVRLSLWEPTDIKGIPYYNPTSQTMEWAPPVELPSDPESTAVLFLDELNSAAPATQAAAYQLILNRRIGTYRLPKGVSIVAAGNRDGDKGVTYRMPAPLANRFLHLEMKVDHDDWEAWAINNNIHEQVIGYLACNKQDLNDFDPRSASRSFATPRSWATVSRFLSDDTISESTLIDLVSGSIGDGLALKFMAHRNLAGTLPKASDILIGKVTKLDNKDDISISAMYSLTVSMLYELRTEMTDLGFEGKANVEKLKEDPTKFAKYNNWIIKTDNFLNFLMNNLETEICVMGVASGFSRYKIAFNSAGDAFKEFTARYKDSITKAVTGR